MLGIYTYFTSVTCSNSKVLLLQLKIKTIFKEKFLPGIIVKTYNPRV